MTDLTSLAEPGRVIEVRVTPNASREQVTLDGERFLIRVTCPPEDGKANKAVSKLLAKALGVAPTRLTLVKGQTGRDKQFRVD
jgi:uncharacterized protein (TIGR00251 family)